MPRTSDKNLEELWQIRHGIPYKLQAEFTSTFIGALSSNVPVEVWDRALRIAKDTVYPATTDTPILVVEQ